MIRSTQAMAAAVVLLLGCAVVRAGDAEPVKHRCEELIQSAITRPYGIAWPGETTHDSSATDDARPRRGSRGTLVSFEPRLTPGIALLLTEASDRLKDPKLGVPAIDAAKGIAAAQDRTGRIPSAAIFAATAQGTDKSVAEPDRAPTRAAISALLSVISLEAMAAESDGAAGSASQTSHDRLKRAAARAAQWLLKQQAQNGSWPVAEPPDAPTGKAVRIVRLDIDEYRDSTLALMLAASLLEDPLLRKGSAAAVRQLEALRIDVPDHQGRGLWGTAYQPNGTPDVATLPESGELDLLATRNAMMTLLSAYLVLDDAPAIESLTKAAGAVERLRTPEGQWLRFPGRAPSTQAVLVRDPETVDFSPLLAALATVNKLGRDAALEQLSGGLDPARHVAAVLCDLVEAPFVEASAGSSAPQPIFAAPSDNVQADLTLAAWEELMKVR